MRKSRLIVIRHGETDYNRNQQLQGRGLDAPLNETGHNQARAVAEYLKSYRIDRVVSSSMLRARQSAGYISGLTGRELISHADLDEMNFGRFEGKNLGEISSDIEDIHQKWKRGEVSLPVPGGESPAEVLERADGRIRLYLKEYQGDNIALVIHGRLIRILLSHWIGLGLQNMEQIAHANCGVNQLSWNGGGFEVIYLNKTDHLVNC